MRSLCSISNSDIDKKPDQKHGYWRSSFLWIPLLACTSILLIVDLVEIQLFSYETIQQHLQPLAQHQVRNLTNDHGKYTIDQKGCRIPYLDAFDKAVLPFISRESPLNCTTNVTAPPIVTHYDNVLYINTDGYRNSSVVCCAREFWRIPPTGGHKDTLHKKSDTCRPLQNDVENTMTEEFVIAECTIDERPYFYFIAFVPAKKVEKKLVQPPKEPYLSILIIGIDAVSRLNLHRQMPKTVDYLTDILEAQEMLGYNKVEDNTFPNLMPVLTGLAGYEISEGCLKETEHSRFDNCPFVWNMFNERNYVTAYAEDATWMGLFTYNRNGFLKEPVDYDYRVFDQLAADTIGGAHSLNSDLCLGATKRIVQLLQYTTDFALTFKNHPYFGMFWGVSISHDYLNLPQVVDDDYVAMLEKLKDSGALENTALFVMSDHGIRWGGIRSTYQGFIEERLPFLFIRLPKWFRDNYSAAWANIITNTKRLTTPYNLHETLIDIKNLQSLEASNLKVRQEKLNAQNATRGISLFLQVPKSRTCEVSGIPDHWCTCQSYTQMEITDEMVIKAVDFVITQINGMLAGYRHCATLKLATINNARKALTNSKEKLKHVIPEYMVSFTTVPGNGTFEATVRERKNTFELAGTISRTNVYGEQSRCITDFHLKLYCYCLSALDSLNR